MNFASICIAVGVAVLLILALRYTLKNGASCDACGGGCGGSCHGSCSFDPDKVPERFKLKK